MSTNHNGSPTSSSIITTSRKNTTTYSCLRISLCASTSQLVYDNRFNCLSLAAILFAGLLIPSLALAQPTTLLETPELPEFGRPGELSTQDQNAIDQQALQTLQAENTTIPATDEETTATTTDDGGGAAGGGGGTGTGDTDNAD